tara:strand:+ start:200 stop:376 length:177 start_codon:yes stop_codon:yes gene_type:complete
MKTLTIITGWLSIFFLALSFLQIALHGAEFWTWAHSLGVFGTVICAVGCYAAWLAEDC